MRFRVFVFLLLSFSLLSAGIYVLEETSERIVVKITLDDMTIEDGSDFTYINVLDWTGEGLPGAPDLAVKILNIAIPPHGYIKTKVLSQNVQRKMLNKPVSPVPTIRKGGKTYDYIFEIDQDLYSRGRAEMIQVQEETRAGFFTVLPIKLSPFNYNAVTFELTYCDELVLQIDITGETSYHNRLSGKFESVYQDFILNYKSAKYWKTRASRKINSIPFEKSDFWYKFELPQDGLYELTFDELSQLPSFTDPASVRILTMYREIVANDPQQYFFKLKEVPIFIEDGNDGSFDKGDRIFFFRENYEVPGLIQYSDKKIFWLTVGGEYDNKPLRLKDIKNVNTVERVENFIRRLPEIPSRGREGIECIIIYPEQGVFEAHAQELANLHSDLVCELKSQADIFAEYGQIDYAAVKSYLDTLNAQNPETLEYVILMGSGIRDWDPQNEKCKIVTYPITSHPDSAVSDDMFVDFNNNVYPDLIIGRIPAKNDDDMDLYIERITDYILNPNHGFWRNKILLVADDEHKKGSLEGTSSSAMNHTAWAEDVGEVLNKGLFIDKVYGIEYNFDEYQNKPDARDAMLNKINDGRLIWYFIGHGNEDVLGDEDYFRGSVHLRLLQNAEYLPLFIAASCSVGKYDEPSYDCISEKLLFYDDGGSIASLAATESCDPISNTTLIKHFLVSSINERENIGLSLFDAKHNSGANSGNSRLYNILGDSILLVTQPEILGYIHGVPDSLRARELAQVNGNFGESSFINEIGECRVYESEYDIFYTNSMVISTPSGPDTLVYSVDYTRNGNSFFNGEIDITNGNYDAQFIVPDDVHAGDKGRLISYVSEDSQNKDYLNYFYPLLLSSIPIDTLNTDPPQVTLWLDSRKFMDGDYVSTDPLLIAEIEDENGINILGSSGHKILLILDNSFELIDVTSGFVYNVGSCTKGELSWQLFDLEEGSHTLQLIVFDNFNNPTVAETTFKAKSSGKVAIEQMLPYPNPMKKDGHFTFVITEDSDIAISIYTITGRKIRTLKKPSCEAGYNQIYWDGRDGDGDEIANNTYFYKIKAKQLSNSKVTEKIGKVIILK
ncbi:MAG: hypothetical protein ISS80_03895 [Candidatus Cloacimonetes bacterium]|nr:hypothetical protein [Candidatus Cloacimonadota bacterium]MBL7149195.1 hypothetical protein [Candidatus Cloacimonadota bacterium]